MPANTTPIFGLTPNVSSTSITQTAVVTGSVGIGTIGTSIFLAFTAGSNGSFVQKVRFMSVATAPTTGVATVLRVYYSTVNTGATTAANTFLLGELSVPAVPSANATNATSYYELPLNFALKTGQYILVSQHTAQTAGQNWIASVIGSDY
jgi:hypothetical protein